MKKVFIGVLAALMLVAFTACEQQPNVWNPNGKTIESVTILSGSTDYLVYQPFDASRYTLEVLYEDGTTDEKNGDGILKLADGMNLLAGAKPVEVTIGNYAGTLVVNYYAIDKLTISGAATTSVPAGTTDPDKIDLTGAVVTAYYANNSKSVELASNEYKVTSVVATTADPDKDDEGTVFVRYTALPVEADDDATKNASYYATFSVDVTEVKTPTANDVTSIKSAVLSEGHENVFITDTPATALAAGNWTVIGETPYGDYTFKSGEFTVSLPTSFATSGSYKVEIKATAAEVSYVTSVTVLKDLDSATITASGALALTASKNEDIELTPAQFASLIKANDKETSQAATGFTVTSISQVLIPRTSDSATVNIEFTWGGNSGAKTYTLNNISVNVTRQ